MNSRSRTIRATATGQECFTRMAPSTGSTMALGQISFERMAAQGWTYLDIEAQFCYDNYPSCKVFVDTSGAPHLYFRKRPVFAGPLLTASHGRTITSPFMPSSSWKAHMNGYVPGLVKVTRKRVTPTGGCTCAIGAGACATPARS